MTTSFRRFQSSFPRCARQLEGCCWRQRRRSQPVKVVTMSTVFDESRGKHGRWPLLTAGTAFCGTGLRAAPQDYSQLHVAARIAAGHCQPRPAQRAPLADAGRFGLTST